MSHVKAPANQGSAFINVMVIVCVVGIIPAIALPYIIRYKRMPGPYGLDCFGGTLEYRNGRVESWPVDIMVEKHNGDPVILYMPERPEGPVKVFELKKKEGISLDEFREMMRNKSDGK